MLRAGTALILALLLTGCGSDLHVRLFVSINAPAELRTHGSFIILSGVAGLPAGSVRGPGTNCRPGTFAIVWTNTANGTKGHVFANWNCPADSLDWRSDRIPLVPGINAISVTMTDELGSADSAVTVRRD